MSWQDEAKERNDRAKQEADERWAKQQADDAARRDAENLRQQQQAAQDEWQRRMQGY